MTSDLRYCPECGEPLIGPLMFGEMSCSDVACDYMLWLCEGCGEDASVGGHGPNQGFGGCV